MFSNSRTAFWYGIQELQIKSGQTILVPEYICDVVLHPLHDIGINTIFYPVNNDFSPDWKYIDNILIKKSITALLLVHYFSQPQNIERAIEICEKYKLWLIEDNAHGYGGLLNGKPLGCFGHMGFSSPRKNLQTASGGVLYIHGELMEPEKYSLKDYPVVRSTEYAHNLIKSFPRLKNKIRIFLRSEPDYSEPSLFQEEKEEYFKVDENSKNKILTEDWQEHAKKRRKNWIFWSDFSLRNGMLPIWSSPHPESCPWLMPVYVVNAEDRLKWLNWGWKNGINLTPWPSLPLQVLNNSPISVNLWKHLLCFPLDREYEIKGFV